MRFNSKKNNKIFYNNNNNNNNKMFTCLILNIFIHVEFPYNYLKVYWLLTALITLPTPGSGVDRLVKSVCKSFVLVLIGANMVLN
jgi:hypothetical protein